ncbi:MAG: 30S ribosomal protein S5 [Candidatus Makaraimicrobium thalassicum]|nr:MAG: 30S ribosomal protein S5 [Candidatus Omnitrophota bacterium]
MSSKEKEDTGASEQKEVVASGSESSPADTPEALVKPDASDAGRPGITGGWKAAKKAEGELTEHVIKINRVSKVVKGGKNFSFSATVIAGDGNGRVGVGLGKSNEVVEAIKKAAVKAKKSFIRINMRGNTIPHDVIGEFKASRVLMKPAGPGTGVIAGGPVRALCDAAGIKNILTKSFGSRNSLNVVRAAIDGFERLRLKRRG